MNATFLKSITSVFFTDWEDNCLFTQCFNVWICDLLFAYNHMSNFFVMKNTLVFGADLIKQYKSGPSVAQKNSNESLGIEYFMLLVLGLSLMVRSIRTMYYHASLSLSEILK